MALYGILEKSCTDLWGHAYLRVCACMYGCMYASMAESTCGHFREHAMKVRTALKTTKVDFEKHDIKQHMLLCLCCQSQVIWHGSRM